MIQRTLFLLALISAVFGITLGVDASRRGLLMQQFPVSGGGGPTLLIEDQFPGANNVTIAGTTPSVVNTPGNTWVVLTPSGDVRSDGAGNAFGTAGSAPYSYASIDAGISDCTLKTQLSGNSMTAFGAGVVFRSTNYLNGLFVRASTTSPYFRIVIVSGGTETLLASTTAVTMTSGDEIELTVVLSGSSIDARMTNITTAAGTTLSYSTNFNQTITSHGVYSRSGGWPVRYFQVYSP